MSLKSELQTHTSALLAYTSSNYPLALELFGRIADTSKIQWNMGVILATMSKHEQAVERYTEAVGMDRWMVVGWLQRGVSWFVSSYCRMSDPCIATHSPSLIRILC
jgi:neutrophil factor 2